MPYMERVKQEQDMLSSLPTNSKERFFCSFGWFSYSVIFEITYGILLLVMWPFKKNMLFDCF